MLFRDLWYEVEIDLDSLNYLSPMIQTRFRSFGEKVHLMNNKLAGPPHIHHLTKLS